MYLSSPSRLRRGLVALVVLALSGLTPLLSSGAAAPAAAADAAPSRGYWMVASDGGVFSYGGAKFFGSTGAVKLNMPIVGMAPTPSGNGYWLVASDGGIFTFGDARFFGSTGAIKLNKPIVGMAATPSGQGYWLVATDGGIFSFGDARFFGSTGNVKLNKPITGMAASSTGGGYRMVASDGGIFSFGDAPFYGSTGGMTLAKPISGMTPTPSGKGYWLVGGDGALFPFGDAVSHGAPTSLRSVAAVTSTPSGAGYWAVAADGSLASFGDAVDLGHPTGALARPIVGMAAYAPASAGPGTSVAPGGGPGTGPDTTPTTVPPVSVLDKLYASHALDGTIGTRPQLIQDPSHPFRAMCDPWPNCHTTESNANYAEEVRAIALVGNRLFIGGFIHGLLDPSTGGKGTKISDEINYLVELDATTGKLAADQTFMHNAAPDATVESITPSPDGQRLYIGGRFLRAGGASAPQIAALDLRTGLQDPTFNPSAAHTGSIHAIALAGDRLYIGGAFKDVDGKTQFNKVAALDARTGRLIDGWVPPVLSGSYIDRAGTPTAGDAGAVDALAVIGQYLVVGGEFVHVGADAPTTDYDPHGGLTALNLADGSRATWRPHNDRPVFGLALSPDRTKICAAEGGQGGTVSCLVAGQDEPIFDTGKKPVDSGMNAHNLLDRHMVHTDGDILGVTLTDTRIYAGGHFDVEEPDPDAACLHSVPSRCMPPYSKTATPHRHIVAWDWNGNVDPNFTPQADTPEGPSVMLAGPNALYVGGNFKNTLDKHPDAGCWPSCASHGAAVNYFHPGFAILPAK